MLNKSPVRSRNTNDFVHRVPVHVVWEITLACNLKCQHCGSRAGKPREDELDTAECLEIIEHLASLGTREITLIGGEAYLRKDWLLLVSKCSEFGIYCALQTGGRGLTPARLDSAVAAGLGGVGVSIDGLRDLHDSVRGVRGSYDMAMNVVKHAKSIGLNRSVNTQIGPETIAQLPDLMSEIIDAGAQQWQVQLTVAMGNAVDNPELLLQPYQLLDLFPLLSQLFDEGKEQGLTMVIGNNIGFFGPYESKLRSVDAFDDHWQGCTAGQTAIGIEADGTVKGCPSLPTNEYAGGNVRNLKIEDIWNKSPEIHFGITRSREELWGFCKTCYYSDVCKGGCTWTAHSLLGRPGNNPYCHHRALELDREGLRERIVKVEDAAGGSFDIGRFEVITEKLDPLSSVRTQISSSEEEVHVQLLRPIGGFGEPIVKPEGTEPEKLVSCSECGYFAKIDMAKCPHCAADMILQQESKRQRHAAMNRLSELLERVTRK